MDQPLSGGGDEGIEMLRRHGRRYAQTSRRGETAVSYGAHEQLNPCQTKGVFLAMK